MAELTDRIRGLFRHTPASSFAQQEAARSQLHGHIDKILLDGFIRRSLPPEQHKTVVDHLGKCQDCQEAIAVALLAHEDPRAAAEIVLESEKRARNHTVWWRVALRWTSIVAGLFVLVLLMYFLPSAGNSGWLGEFFKPKNQPSASHRSDSDTSYSNWIASTVSNQDEKPVERPRKRSADPAKQVSQGWNTGPAPYHDKVQATSGPMEIQIPPPVETKSDQAKLKTPESVAAASAPQTSPANQGTAQPSSKNRLLVTDEGELMRTMDGGQSWKIITIKRGLALNSLAVAGSYIWAAGDGGALYRSPDAAEHWQQATVSYRGVSLVSNIEQIRFADPQHGDFKTANGEVWITVDGGSHWILSYRTKGAQ